MRKADTACFKPPTPSNQITMAAPSASMIATTASISAPASVESAGTISSAPDRTMITAITVAASENSAIRRAQIASRDTGWSMIRCRAIVIRFRRLAAPGCRATYRQSANLFERAPIPGIEQRPRCAGAGQRIDGADALLGFGMVEQDLHTVLLVGHDTRQDCRQRMRVATGLVHQCDAVGVCRRLDAARIGRTQHGLGGDHHRAATDKIAKHHAEQERQA